MYFRRYNETEIILISNTSTTFKELKEYQRTKT